MYRGQNEQTKNNDYNTTVREDTIIDSNSCVNVREWRACVNMDDRLITGTQYVCANACCVRVRV